MIAQIPWQRMKIHFHIVIHSEMNSSQDKWNTDENIGEKIGKSLSVAIVSYFFEDANIKLYCHRTGLKVGNMWVPRANYSASLISPSMMMMWRNFSTTISTPSIYCCLSLCSILFWWLRACAELSWAICQFCKENNRKLIHICQFSGKICWLPISKEHLKMWIQVDDNFQVLTKQLGLLLGSPYTQKYYII